MSRFRRFEIMEEEPFCYYSPPPLLFTETLTFPSLFEDSLALDLDLDLFPLFNSLDVVTDLVRGNRKPSFLCRRVHRVERKNGVELHLQSLCDRVDELESRLNRIVSGKSEGGSGGGDRKYTWTAEINGAEKNGFGRKYKWIAEIVEEEKKKSKLRNAVEKNVKFTAEIKGKGDDSGSTRKYTFAMESGDAEKEKEKVKSEKAKEKKKTKKENRLRIVDIEEPSGHRDVVLRQSFPKRFRAVQNDRGKRKELSPQDAAYLIQITFRAYLIRRSKALRALRELAVAKSKLNEIRAQFNNFSYRRRLASDAVERQRFSEKIIVLLLTVDAIETVDLMVRSAKKSMVDELEAMLDVCDPQPAGRSLSFKRRTFDMPDGVIRKEIEDGVAQVVQMLDEAENNSSTFEACL